MENKTIEINNLVHKLSQEDFSGYEFVDYWDADTTALGLQKGNVVIYISTFNHTNTDNYDLIIEELETGNVLKSEDKRSYHELIDDIQPFLS
ncbi:hypothetical protein [Chryseobacterium viscerum]|uniref:Uncharacterized protein n=1 Tax=Chryseobacterium viscerum TaxID=1037377 RepID=A0A5N4BU76_9FLAO|nr:hypothetical protein [Chryseobacterium viscerum]KAB1231999.1 hypothetical protein F8D52_05020 [Chryseobacterium viscerum]